MPIVVWAGDFDENSGGQIVLHVLAYRLKELGQDVYIANESTIEPWGIVRGAVQRIKYWNRARLARKRKQPPPRGRDLLCHQTMPIPTLRHLPKEPFVAVYPEIVDGNPFGAPHVVRWLLHRAGFHNNAARFTQGEVTFFYQAAFAEGTVEVDQKRHLQVRWLRTDIYRDEMLPERSGSCRMVRKGTGTFSPGLAEGDAAPLLDGMTHAQIAAIFNRCDRFYCHDPYTMYLYYAALCGCIPIVVPQPGLDAKSWRDGFELKQGVAYGEDELDFARATREGLLADMAAATEIEIASVVQFLETMNDHTLR
jgi:hypothetical protein